MVEICAQLTQELQLAVAAANQAHQGAIDDQSVAETQYDTLAIEQSYLAQGQSQRVAKIRQAIDILTSFQQRLALAQAEQELTVKVGSLVQLAQDKAKQHWYFIVPVAGGYRCQLTQQSSCYKITLLTPQSPMGAALLAQSLDDDVTLTVVGKTTTDYLCAIE
ncbi:GreA/GreB family elongation factor [Colwellia chukchiensis]|uniref:GreA/GreB family elongation factor n=1 Tax=Colwellia chukchiensis TaxID=641665 RepID=A0A1H7QLI9_9GAMM|nr:hypothetical protein [Colwellia chukchiensis]SEL48475.1 GreA/GreB family elongation factor [Colwellia chukchiensis]